MKKYILGLSVFLAFLVLPDSVMAAIAFDSTLGQVTGSGSGAITGIDLSGSDGYIEVAVIIELTSNTVISLNFDNGSGSDVQTFTQIGTNNDINSGNYRQTLWRLVNPSLNSGRRIILTLSGGSNFNMGAVYYTGVDQTTPTANVTQSVDLSSGASAINTSNLDGSWQAGTTWATFTDSLSGGVNRQNVQNANNIGYLIDSNATVANTSTNVFSWTWNGVIAESGYITYMLRPSSSEGDPGSGPDDPTGNLFFQPGALLDTISNGALNFGTIMTTTMTLGRVGQNLIINSNVGIGILSPSSALEVNGNVKAKTFSTASNCASSTSPALCADAPAGSVAMPPKSDTLVVNTSAITPNSQIMLTEDASLNDRLGVTCETGDKHDYRVTARAPGTSFTIKSNGNTGRNRTCLSYLIVN